ncbi:MAG: hypothetical protein K2W82_12980 [Candidatus Obscuribacterales bacterium]|nr:hypothetical protein [Candidatus Obscuribacterales bacterium]
MQQPMTLPVRKPVTEALEAAYRSEETFALSVAVTQLRSGKIIVCPNKQNPINNRRRLVRDLMPY